MFVEGKKIPYTSGKHHTLLPGNDFPGRLLDSDTTADLIPCSNYSADKRRQTFPPFACNSTSKKYTMEGPALTLLKEEAQPFTGKRITEAGGSSKIDMDSLAGQRLNKLQSCGKHFLMVFDNCTIRIHYLMFGNYYLNSRHPEKEPKLSLLFDDGSEWNNYNCAVRILPETDMSRLYDFSIDIMDESWNAANAKAKLKQHPEMLVCDALMNQDIFAGVGNVIKNEALFRIRVQPESKLGALPPEKITALLEEAHNYSYDFYRWRKEGVLRKKYCVHRRKYCPVCHALLVKKFTGELQRSSFYCSHDQLLYT